MSRSTVPEDQDEADALPDSLEDGGEVEWTAEDAWGEDEVLACRTSASTARLLNDALTTLMLSDGRHSGAAYVARRLIIFSRGMHLRRAVLR